MSVLIEPVMHQYIFEMPGGRTVGAVAENVRQAIENLLATGDRMWISVRGQSEDDRLTRSDYACMVYDEWKWEKKYRTLMMESFIESLKPKELVDSDPNKPVFQKQIPAEALAKAESKKQLQLAL